MDNISEYFSDMYKFDDYISELDYWLSRIKNDNENLKTKIGVANKEFIFQAIESFVCLGVIIERAMIKYLQEAGKLNEQERNNISFRNLTNQFYEDKQTEEKENEIVKIGEIRTYRNIGAHGKMTELKGLLDEEVKEMSANTLLEKKQIFLTQKIDSSLNFVDAFIKKYL